MSNRTPRPYHVAGQRPLSPHSIEIPAEAVVRFLDRLEPAGGGCMTLRRLAVGRPRTSSRPRAYAKVLWTDEAGNTHQIKAHRLALMLRIGPIPAGRLACHRCDNAACCSGAHLYAGTFADNEADKIHAKRIRDRGLSRVLHPVRQRPFMACRDVRMD